jgi:mannose-6-phosphate isomerase-like protein (cupin superfamily)
MANGAREKVLNLRSVFGLEATVTTPSEATNGAYVELDILLEPGGRTTLHTHPQQEETFAVLDGTLEVFRDGGWHPVPARQTLTVPLGVVHAVRNPSETPVRFLNVHRPALSFQEYLETLDRLIRAGKVKGLKGLRSGIYVSMAAVENGISGTVKPPQWLIRALAFIGRRLGYTLD